MTLTQIYEYLKVHYYLSPFSSENYLQKRLIKLNNAGYINRMKNNIYKGRKPSYIYSIGINAIKYIPEIDDLKNKEKIFKPIDNKIIDNILILTDLMIYLEKAVMENRSAFDYWFKYQEISFDLNFDDNKKKLTPLGAMVIKNEEYLYNLIIIENINANNIYLYQKNESIESKILLYEILFANKKENLIKDIKINNVIAIYLVNDQDQVNKITEWLIQNPVMNYKIKLILKQKKYNIQELKEMIKF